MMAHPIPACHVSSLHHSGVTERVCLIQVPERLSDRFEAVSPRSRKFMSYAIEMHSLHLMEWQ
jgi:hypothetical protein